MFFAIRVGVALLLVSSRLQVSTVTVIATDGELSAVPEPSSMVLIGTGVWACARRLWRRGR